MSEFTFIAVIDDHILFRRGLVHLINLFTDYKVLLEADNGRDFIEKLKAPVYPDIVLLDINMPVMDGYATAAWIKVNCPETKILTLSMLDSEASIIKMIRNGSRGYIMKDADTTELKLALKELRDKGFYYNEIVSRKLFQSIHELADEKSMISMLVNFSEREVQFLKLCCSEKTYKDIAAEMFVSERTVDGYREALFRKLNLTSRVGLAMFAIKNGFVQL